MAFQKGQSGNPKGRALEDAAQKQLKELCRREGPKAIEVLKFWMNQKKNAKAAIAAAKEILDRGFGKATQAVELTGENGGPIQAVIRFGSERVDN